MTIRPLHDKILIRIASAQEIKLKSKIIIPANVAVDASSTIEGLVVAVGPGKRLKNGTYRPLLIEPGEKILVGKYAGSRLNIENVLHMLVVEKDIVCLLPDEP
jgi:chaperonin GroES